MLVINIILTHVKSCYGPYKFCRSNHYYNTHHEAYLRLSLRGSAVSSSQMRFMCLDRLHQPVDRFIVKVNNPESCNNIMSIDFLDIKLPTNGTRRSSLFFSQINIITLLIVRQCRVGRNYIATRRISCHNPTP